MYGNVFYFRVLNRIGGIEQFFWNLARKYAERDITIVYREGDAGQVARLREYVRTVRFSGQRIRCRKAFFCFNLDIIDFVEAEEYIQVEHGDYKAMGILPNTSPKLTGYIGVSETVCASFEEITGKRPALCYNPFVAEKPKRVLHLISATRLTREKGRRRIEQLADALTAAGVRFIWTVYTDSTAVFRNQDIILRPARLDLADFVADADYLVQLSDNEGWCYSVVEALTLGTPVIVTDCPVFTELGVQDGVNGWILPFDMAEIPAEAIARGLKKPKYRAPVDRWDELLAPGASTWQEERRQPVTVEAVRDYYDMVLERSVKNEERLTVERSRAEQLEDAKVARSLAEHDGG